MLVAIRKTQERIPISALPSETAKMMLGSAVGGEQSGGFCAQQQSRAPIFGCKIAVVALSFPVPREILPIASAFSVSM